MRDSNPESNAASNSLTLTISQADADRIAKRNAESGIHSITITIAYRDGYRESITLCDPISSN
jgi:hypothetical protein